MTNSSQDLSNESQRATVLLQGKVVANIWRHKENELVILFTDGTRLFAETHQSALELSITGAG